MLDNTLIENALKLTGKTMEDMDWEYRWNDTEYFSIEKFCYYLLSPEFIYKYIWELWLSDSLSERYNVWLFWNAIYEYQSGNEKPLIELLSKIWN